MHAELRWCIFTLNSVSRGNRLILVVLPTALVPTRIPYALHAFPFCRFQSQQNLQVPEFECLRHIFAHKLGFAFKRSALASTLHMEKPFD